jgi:glyoxylase-like metal-dependent hydrolase (beta-lactamase superfamily II)
MRKTIFVLALSLLLVPGLVLAEEPTRKITNIAGDLYRFQSNFHFSVFLVTPEGVIATDPIDAEAAKWLKAEIKKRFGQEVKYLVYSHDHRDHISGGEVFDDTAAVVAHQLTKAAIIGEKRPTAVPEVTFTDRLTIELGGKVVNLFYVGPSHSDNSIVMQFPEEKTIFAVDIVSVNRLPYKDLGDSYLPGWIEALRLVETLEFDILAPGHGPLGTRDDLSAHLAYFEELYAKVLAGARQGKTLEELQKSITMEKYKEWEQYNDWLPLNIKGIYERVSLQRRGN